MLSTARTDLRPSQPIPGLRCSTYPVKTMENNPEFTTQSFSWFCRERCKSKGGGAGEAALLCVCALLLRVGEIRLITYFAYNWAQAAIIGRAPPGCQPALAPHASQQYLQSEPVQQYRYRHPLLTFQAAPVASQPTDWTSIRWDISFWLLAWAEQRPEQTRAALLVWCHQPFQTTHWKSPQPREPISCFMSSWSFSRCLERLIVTLLLFAW